MDMIGKVGRMKLRDQLSDGEICRRTGLAQNTVKKWLRALGDIPPKYRRKKSEGKLTPFGPTLEQALRADGHRAKNARRSGKALVVQIQAQGSEVAIAQSRNSCAGGLRRASKIPPKPLYL